MFAVQVSNPNYNPRTPNVAGKGRFLTDMTLVTEVNDTSKLSTVIKTDYEGENVSKRVDAHYKRNAITMPITKDIIGTMNPQQNNFVLSGDSLPQLSTA